jgi:hypothetical protein
MRKGKEKRMERWMNKGRQERRGKRGEGWRGEMDEQRETGKETGKRGGGWRGEMDEQRETGKERGKRGEGWRGEMDEQRETGKEREEGRDGLTKGDRKGEREEGRGMKVVPSVGLTASGKLSQGRVQEGQG